MAVFYFRKNKIVEKQTLRKLYLEKRAGLTSDEIETKTLAIVRNFSTINFIQVKYLHVFYPIAAKFEFNSLLLADWIRSNYPEIKLVLSKSNFETNILSHFIWDADTKLAMNAWGITEPETGITIDPGLLDMILIPLLAFDKKGNRIGYGKGFYDRFLTECRPDAQKTGVSFFPPVDEITDVNKFDVALDMCVTPEKIWRLQEY
ncbi:MAG TPA: 5-formyltetrahydrofolate cyclo-ligase [Sphingobacteriaceae bacterium]|nr:5-formyltetrahydrofolate cyclo-ligase [Sphingobacteriaceae bacterium]